MWTVNCTKVITIRKYFHPVIITYVEYENVTVKLWKCRKNWHTFSIIACLLSLSWQPLRTWFSRNEMMLATSVCVSQSEFHLQYEWTIAETLRKNWASALFHFSKGVIILIVCKSGLQKKVINYHLFKSVNT